MPIVCTSPGEPDWAALAAIDWGSQKHFWSLLPVNGGSPETGILDNTPEAVDVWAADLRRRFAGRPIAVALEQKRGAVVYLLGKYDHLVLYPIPSSLSATYREAFFPSGAKSDAGDSNLLLELLVHHRSRLRPRRCDTLETRLLYFLVEWRRQLVQQKVAHVQCLGDCLQQYFPQLRRWFARLDSPLLAALLRRWPLLEDLQRAHPGTLKRFFGQHNCRKAELVQQRMQAIYAAIPATDDAAVLEACRHKTEVQLQLLEIFRTQIATVEKRIQQLVAVHPDAAIFASFPGAGPATVPRLIAAFGTYRDAYSNASDLQRFSGIAPVLKASGKSSLTRMRRACPKFLRQTFHEFAAQSIPRSAWAKDYYQHHRNDCAASHHAAVRSLAFKWMRILYRCWKDHRPYEEAIFLNSQRRRRSLLGPDLASVTNPRRQTQGGLRKLASQP